MTYGVLLDEAHDTAWRVCAKEQVLTHPRPTSPPLAWLSIHHIAKMWLCHEKIAFGKKNTDSRKTNLALQSTEKLRIIQAQRKPR